ncbi:LacI family DNA-binding transcriptional regulator [Pelagibacterium halotolerans]|uniref:LacI family DNA-binding transcriptional regulator n=1 Tax=Pelagibacterium halotolerans TaxID=531813 RepID=UPI0038503C73
MAKPRLKDVAQAAGVSQGTVSNVFNRPELVRPELREKVHEVAQTLGYRGPNPAGRVLRAGKAGAIGIVTSNPSHYFFDDPFARLFMSGVTDAMSETGSTISLISTQDGAVADRVISDALVDGFIVLCAEEGDPLATKAATRGLPTVRVDAPSDGKASGVIIDDRAGARMAARHLIDLGHHRLAAFLTGSPGLTGEYYCGAAPERARGYREAAAGLPADALTIEHTGSEPHAIRSAMERLLGGPDPVTGILAMSDKLAITVLAIAEAMNLRVPEDVSVIGFDDVPEAALCSPKLTTIRQPAWEKGAAAARLLLDEPARTVELPLQLVVRGSTAPPGGPPQAR